MCRNHSVITSSLLITETKFENPPLGMIEGSVLKSLRRHRAADCFTTSNVSLIISQMYLPTTRTLDNNNGLPGHEQLWNVSTKCFGHVLGANVGDALKSKRNVHRIPENGKNYLMRFILKVEPAGQVVLDGLHDELDQLRVSRYQNRDEEIALWENNTFVDISVI